MKQPRVSIVDKESGRLKLSSSLTEDEYTNLIDEGRVDLELINLYRDLQTCVANIRSV